MRIDIWSDVVCPFCYIGKRHLEEALRQFPYHNEVEIVWHSFLLNPNQKTDTTISLHQSLSKTKGWSDAFTQQATAQVVGMAKQAGLDFHMDHVVVANSIRAHRLLHFASIHGKGSLLKEQLFKAYFIDGKNIDDRSALLAFATDLGLDATETISVLDSDRFMDEVKHDLDMASQLRISGVPFFVFASKYGVSGAQPVEVFVDTLHKAYEAWKSSNPAVEEVRQGASCAPEGCD